MNRGKNSDNQTDRTLSNVSAHTHIYTHIITHICTYRFRNAQQDHRAKDQKTTRDAADYKGNADPEVIPSLITTLHQSPPSIEDTARTMFG